MRADLFKYTNDTEKADKVKAEADKLATSLKQRQPQPEQPKFDLSKYKKKPVTPQAADNSLDLNTPGVTSPNQKDVVTTSFLEGKDQGRPLSSYAPVKLAMNLPFAVAQDTWLTLTSQKYRERKSMEQAPGNVPAWVDVLNAAGMSPEVNIAQDVALAGLNKQTLKYGVQKTGQELAQAGKKAIKPLEPAIEAARNPATRQAGYMRVGGISAKNAEEAQAELEGIRAELAQDPVANYKIQQPYTQTVKGEKQAATRNIDLTSLLPKSGSFKGQTPEAITINQAKTYLGAKDIPAEAMYPAGHKYAGKVRPEYVTDQVAERLGFAGHDELFNRIEYINNLKLKEQQLKDMVAKGDQPINATVQTGLPGMEQEGAQSQMFENLRGAANKQPLIDMAEVQAQKARSTQQKLIELTPIEQRQIWQKAVENSDIPPETTIDDFVRNFGDDTFDTNTGSMINEALITEQPIKQAESVPLNSGDVPPKPPISNIPEGKPIPNGPDEILSNYLKNPDRVKESIRQRKIFNVQRAARLNEKFAPELEKLLSQGLSPEDALKQATSQMSGELSRFKTTLGDILPDDVRQSLYQKIIDKYGANDFRTLSATKALDNALAGKPIPNVPGIRGGSALKLLRDTFDTDVINLLEKPDEWQLKMMTNPQGVAGGLRPVPSTLGASQGEMIERPLLSGIAESEQRSKPITGLTGGNGVSDPIALQTFKENLGVAQKPEGVKNWVDYPSNQPFMNQPMQGANSPLQSSLFPDQPSTVQFTGGNKPSTQPELDALKLKTWQGKEAEGVKNWDALPDGTVGKQLSMLPESGRIAANNALKKAGVTALDVLNLPRSFITAFDLSASGRQGLIMSISHPLMAAKSFKNQIKALFSEDAANALTKEIQARPHTAQAIARGKLFFADVAGPLTQREEAIASRFATKIPFVKQSQRAFTAFLNDISSQVYEKGADVIIKAGGNSKDLDSLAEYVNWARGRGSLPQKLQGTANVLNATLFSPRLVLSRLQLPAKLASSNPYVRKEAWKAAVGLLGFGSSALALAYLATGRKPELDPRSSEFAKVRVGNTRLDFWGGYVQYARFAAQFTSGETKSSTTEQVTGKNRTSTLGKIVQSKLSPGAGLFWDALAGETYTGQEMKPNVKDFGTQAYSRLTPLSIQDMIDAMKSEGVIPGAALGGTSALGFGVVTYGNDIQNLQRDWVSDFKDYNKIPTNTVKLKASGLPSRNEYRDKHPDVDAKLFITGAVDSLIDSGSVSAAVKLIQDNKIDWTKIEGIKKRQDNLKEAEKSGVKLDKTKVDRLIEQLEAIKPTQTQPVQAKKKLDFSQYKKTQVTPTPKFDLSKYKKQPVGAK